MRRAWIAAALLCAMIWCAAGCQQAPVTGRSQLILVEPAQENALGAKAYEETLAKSKLSADAATTAVLRRVGQRIAAQANHPEYQWEFNLLESPEVNAFCLPGGKVAVYTGIIPFCHNEAGLAAVVAHEVAHAMARHGAERMSHGLVVELLATGIQAGTAKMNPTAQAGILQAYGVAATVGAELPFSREQEAEADRIGIELMARAGYAPTASVELWKRMAAAEKWRGPAFLSTHPATQSRIDALQSVMPAMTAIYRQSRDPLGEGELLSGAAQK